MIKISDSDFSTINGFSVVSGSISSNLKREEDEISFTGSQKYCVSFVDIVNSTQVTSNIERPEKVRKYYEIFLNSMATIARNYGAKIVKNVGDCLIFYFPETSDLNNEDSFKNVLECCITIQEARSTINEKLEQEQLPSVSYRISSDYGRVEVARSAGFLNDDLFGPTMNICAKINSKASPGGIVIGEGLLKVIRSLLSTGVENYYYRLQELVEFEDLMTGDNMYPVYALMKNDSDRDLLRQTQPKLEQQQQHQQRLQELYSGNILLVDDQEDILYTFETGLAFEGYNVETFEDSMEALKRFAEVNPSYYELAILDIRMPGLNGLQLYYRLKAINRNIKVLFVSALDAVPELISIMPGVKSADDILRKPVSIADLVRTVKKVVSK